MPVRAHLAGGGFASAGTGLLVRLRFDARDGGGGSGMPMVAAVPLAEPRLTGGPMVAAVSLEEPRRTGGGGGGGTPKALAAAALAIGCPGGGPYVTRTQIGWRFGSAEHAVFWEAEVTCSRCLSVGARDQGALSKRARRAKDGAITEQKAEA